MRLTQALAATLLGAALIAGCQPQPAATTEETAPAETVAETAPVAAEEAAVTLPCGVLAQRDWTAELSTGARPTLTVAGNIDLGTPGYGVSLTRDAAEASGATTALLTLSLRAPTGVQTQVVTAHPVRYFAPANGPYTSVQISCDGAVLTTIDLAE